MIKLYVSDYCHNCPEFQAQVESQESYDTKRGYVCGVGVDHVITCTNEEKCSHILNYLRATINNERK